MERKVTFVRTIEGDANAEWAAQHIEPLNSGLVAIIQCFAKFQEVSGEGLAPVIEGSVVITHCGHPIKSIEPVTQLFRPKSASKRVSREILSIGGQKLTVGFGGKSEVRECGWLPKYLYVKIERG